MKLKFNVLPETTYQRSDQTRFLVASYNQHKNESDTRLFPHLSQDFFFPLSNCF